MYAAQFMTAMKPTVDGIISYLQLQFDLKRFGHYLSRFKHNSFDHVMNGKVERALAIDKTHAGHKI